MRENRLQVRGMVHATHGERTQLDGEPSPHMVDDAVPTVRRPHRQRSVLPRVQILVREEAGAVTQPEWMSLPVELWDDGEVLAWLKEWRGEAPLPAVYPVTVEEFLRWLESKGSRGELARRTVKYWLNVYYGEMRRGVGEAEGDA